MQVVPAVLATSAAEFEQNILTAAKLSNRVHIDVTDGEFARSATVNLAQIYWGDTDQADLHLMMNRVVKHKEQLISMKPSLVIIHFEAEDDAKDMRAFMKELRSVGIKVGVAILQATAAKEAASFIKLADHVLVFTGDLGKYGGKLSKECLPKISEIKDINPKAEVSVDGGVNAKNAGRVAASGADVLITGGFTIGADDPKAAYKQLAKAARRGL